MEENYTAEQIEKLQRTNNHMRGCMATFIFIIIS